MNLDVPPSPPEMDAPSTRPSPPRRLPSAAADHRFRHRREGFRNRTAKALLGLVLAVTTLAGASLAGAAPAEAAGTPLSGHRGATGVQGVGEHTIASVDYAARHGAFAIEGDVRWTRDGRMVMVHDATLDRATRCTGPVKGVTFRYLRTCATWTEVPRFASWLKRAKARGLAVNPELKTVPTAAQAKQFVAAIKAAGPSYVVVSSSEPRALVAVKATGIGTRVKYSPIVYAANSKYPMTVAAQRAVGTVVMPDHRSLTRAKVARYHQAGVKVWGWPARSDADVARLKSLGVDVIVVDDVARF